MPAVDGGTAPLLRHLLQYLRFGAVGLAATAVHALAFVALIVLFLPENRQDLHSAAGLAAALEKDHPGALILDLADAALAWERYSLNGTRCHPSPCGYEQIARHVAAALVERGLIEEAMRTAGD
jgi:hypothetical protein